MFLVNLAVADILVLIICAPVSILQVKLLAVVLNAQWTILQRLLFLLGCHKHLDIRDTDVQNCHILSGTLSKALLKKLPFHRGAPKLFNRESLETL